MFAEWTTPTTAATTTITINGVAGYWKEMPDEFPPIAMLDYYGSTTPSEDLNWSCAYEVISTTTFEKSGLVRQRVESFIKNTRWYRLDTGNTNADSATGTSTVVVTYLRYRSVNEPGQGDIQG